MRAAGGECYRRSPRSAASARCAGCTMRRTPPAPRRRRWRSAFRPKRSRLGLRSFPGLAHRMEEVGRRGARSLRQRFQGDQCQFRGAGAGLLQRHFLDRRRQAEDRRHRIAAGFFPRIRKAYLIGEAAEEFAATLDGKPFRTKSPAPSTRHSRPPRAMRETSPARGAGRAAVAGLRLVRSVSAISRCAATPSAPWSARCPGVKCTARNPVLNPLETIAVPPLRPGFPLGRRCWGSHGLARATHAV